MYGVDENLQVETKNAVVNTARDLADRRIPFIEGIRLLAALRFSDSRLEKDPDFMLFVAIASETDHHPSPEVRRHCSPAWLEKCDSEALALQEEHLRLVRLACDRLIERFA
ncbi:MAG: hypothetical protein LBI76_02060 [Comamonas sp.]|jgi:hypothetical protein|nr:hypothetical protein [Comamonas sp.]